MQPDDSPGVMGFNYEASSAPAYKFNTSAQRHRSRKWTHAPNFSPLGQCAADLYSKYSDLKV